MPAPPTLTIAGIIKWRETQLTTGMLLVEDTSQEALLWILVRAESLSSIREVEEEH